MEPNRFADQQPNPFDLSRPAKSDLSRVPSPSNADFDPLQLRRMRGLPGPLRDVHFAPLKRTLFCSMGVLLILTRRSSLALRLSSMAPRGPGSIAKP